MWLRGCCWMLAAPWQKPLHQLPSICAHRCSTIVATLAHCRHLASGKHLAYAWQSLGNRLAIAWQYYGNRSVFLAIAFLSHCRHTKMYAFFDRTARSTSRPSALFMILERKRGRRCVSCALLAWLRGCCCLLPAPYQKEDK